MWWGACCQKKQCSGNLAQKSLGWCLCWGDTKELYFYPNWKIKLKITSSSVSIKMLCKLMETKYAVLESILHSHNEVVLDAKIWSRQSRQQDQLRAPIDNDGLGIWFVELTGTSSLTWMCISGAVVRFQLAEGHLLWAAAESTAQRHRETVEGFSWQCNWGRPDWSACAHRNSEDP